MSHGHLYSCVGNSCQGRGELPAGEVVCVPLEVVCGDAASRRPELMCGMRDRDVRNQCRQQFENRSKLDRSCHSIWPIGTWFYMSAACLNVRWSDPPSRPNLVPRQSANGVVDGAVVFCAVSFSCIKPCRLCTRRIVREFTRARLGVASWLHSGRLGKPDKSGQAFRV